MQITRVTIKLKDRGGFKGSADIVIDDALAICHIRIIEGAKGLFLGFPGVKRENNIFEDFVHPVNQKTREYIEDIVLKEYKIAVESDPYKKY